MSFIDKLKESLPDGVAHQIWEDDELKKNVEVVVGKARTPTPGAPAVSFNTTNLNLSSARPYPTSQGVAQQLSPLQFGTESINYAPSLSNTAADSSLDIFTQALKAATDFDKTDVGKQVAKEMKPLDGLPLNEAQKIGVALKAGAEEGLTGEKIISTLDGILKNLDGERDRFQAQIGGATKTDVDGRKDDIDRMAQQIASLESQITDLRAKQSQASTDMITAQSKLQIKATQFNAAYEARKAELTTSRNHYAEILKGIQ